MTPHQRVVGLLVALSLVGGVSVVCMYWVAAAAADMLLVVAHGGASVWVRGTADRV